MCLMADGVMNYIYQKPFGALGAEDFQSDLLVPVVDFHEMMQWPTYFPRGCGGLFKVTEMLPRWVLERWMKGIITQQECLKAS